MRRLNRASAMVLASLLVGCELADPSTRLVGMWEFTGPDGELGECPDFIGFEPEGDYAVWNECYGADPTDPVVETGSWAMPDSLTLRLTNRELLAGESPWGDAQTVQFAVFELSDDTLRVAAAANAENVERYRRLEEAN